MKRKRQSKIIELITKYEIDTQEELASKLEEAGFKVTQATVSRDIRELNLIKISTGGGKQKYALIKSPDRLDEKYIRILKEGFSDMDAAGNLLIIKTAPGLAMGVAAAIDAIGFEDLLGCIAGDDTIMCAVRTAESIDNMMRRIRTLIV